MLERVVEQNALRFGVAPHEFGDAERTTFADRDRHIWKFSFELQRFIARFDGRVEQADGSKTKRFSAITSAQRGDGDEFIEPVYQKFEVRRFARAAHREVANGNHGQVERDAFQDADAVKKVTNAHAQPVQKRKRKQQNADDDIF